MTGWGSGPWGSTPWGHGVPVGEKTPPVITPLAPAASASGIAQNSSISIQFTDEIQVDGDSITIAVTGTHYVIGGVPMAGANYTSTPNTENGFDVEVTLPTAFPLGSTQEVFVTCLDSDGFLSVLTYYFTVGLGLRLLSVHNPREKTLVVHFNKPLLRNNIFFVTDNWILTKIGDDGEVAEEERPIRVLAVNGNPTNPQNAVLRYQGGDASTYELRVLSITSRDGDPIEDGWDRAQFELGFEEEPEAAVRLFNSIYGPIGVSQKLRSRSPMDDHCASRALAMAIDEQVSIRRAALDDTIGRSGLPGVRRT